MSYSGVRISGISWFKGKPTIGEWKSVYSHFVKTCIPHFPFFDEIRLLEVSKYSESIQADLSGLDSMLDAILSKHLEEDLDYKGIEYTMDAVPHLGIFGPALRNWPGNKPGKRRVEINYLHGGGIMPGDSYAIYMDEALSAPYRQAATVLLIFEDMIRELKVQRLKAHDNDLHRATLKRFADEGERGPEIRWLTWFSHPLAAEILADEPVARPFAGGTLIQLADELPKTVDPAMLEEIVRISKKLNPIKDITPDG